MWAGRRASHWLRSDALLPTGASEARAMAAIGIEDPRFWILDQNPKYDFRRKGKVACEASKAEMGGGQGVQRQQMVENG